MSEENAVPIGFLLQVQGSEEVQAKLNSVGGALTTLDSKAAVTAQTTGDTLPKGFDATSSAADRVKGSVDSAGVSFKQAALGLSAAASGVFALHSQYDRLEKIQVRIATAQKNVTASNASTIEAQRVLDTLVSKGVTSGAKYESAVLRLKAAKEQEAIATDRLSIAQTDLSQGQIQFGLTILPTVFSVIQGVTTAMNFFKTSQVATAGASLILTPALGGTAAAMGATAGAATGAAGATHLLNTAMHFLALNPLILPLTAVAAVFTIIATNAFGARDALNAFGKMLGDLFPFLRPLLDALGYLGSLLPDLSGKADAAATSIDASFSNMAAGVASSADDTAEKLEDLKRKFLEIGKATSSASLRPTSLGGGGGGRRFEDAEIQDDPFLNRFVGSLTEKRQQAVEEKQKIIQQLSELVTGVKIQLSELPTEVPELEDLMSNIRDELSATLKVDFDFNADKIEDEFKEVEEALTRKTGPLPLDLKIRSESLEEQLQFIDERIESVTDKLRDLTGESDLEKIREQAAGGAFMGGKDEAGGIAPFVDFQLNKLDQLGEQARRVEDELRSITHVEFKPFDMTAGAVELSDASERMIQKAKENVQKAITERIRVIEELETLITGSQSRLTDAAKADIPGLRDLARQQQEALKETLDIDFDFGAENLDAELQKVRNAIAEAGGAITTTSSELQGGAQDSFEGVASSATSMSTQVEDSVNAMGSSVTSGSAQISNSLNIMGDVFSLTGDVISEAVRKAARNVGRSFRDILRDIDRVERGLDKIGLNNLKDFVGQDFGRTTRSSSSNRSSQDITITLVNQLDGRELNRSMQKVQTERL